jgi:membrane protein required for colicin V production
MPIIDILIAVAISISVIVGIIRGFVKEAISFAALIVAIWAALYFGPQAGGISENWIGSEASQMWFGRVLVFVVVLFIGGLLGWGLSKIVRMSVMSSMDRFFGSIFGAVRGVLLVALAVIGGQFAEFDSDQWWQESKLIPRLEVVADWIKVMGPKGLELLAPGESAESLNIDVLTDQLKLERT